MINLSMSSNIDRVTARFEGLAARVQNRATLRAINRAVDAVATEANREIRKVYRIKASDLRKAITKKKAFLKQAVMSGSVIFSGRRLNLFYFGARQTKKGVTVQVMQAGGRKLLPGAFLATNSHTGFKGVFHRVGRSRYPIKNLKSIAIPQAVGNKAVNAALRKIANEAFLKNFSQQLNFLTSRV